MSFSVGQAKLILDVDAQPLLEGEAVAWKATRQGAQAVSAFLARENNVRVSDVKKAATIIIDENKRTAREILKAEKELATERKANTKVLLDYNKQQLKEEEKAAKEAAAARKKAIKAAIDEEVRLLKQQEAQRKAIARSIQESEKLIERQRLEEVRRTLQQEATLRRQAAEKRREEEKNSAKGLFGTDISGARVGATAATLLGFGAIASGAVLVREALVKTTEATLKQDIAQRALNASFGKSAGVYKELAESQAKQYNLISSEVQKAVANLGTLDRQSNLSTNQIKALSAVAIDLQAAYGGDLQEAFRSAGAAILGETEALEKYGIVLQDSVLRTLPQLTEEEKKRFTTMSESEKQLIRYRVLMDLAKDSTGAAAQRAKEAQGGFNAFNESVERLVLTIGKAFVDATGEAARSTSTWIDLLEKVVKVNQDYYKIRDEIMAQARKENDEVRARNAQLGRLTRPEELNDNASAINVTFEEVAQRRADKLEDARIAAQRKREQQAIADYIRDRQKKENADTDAANTAMRTRGAKAIKILQEQASKELQIIANRIDFEEKIRDNQLEALQDRKKAELEALEEVEYQRKRASDEELLSIQNAKKAALEAADDVRDAELEKIEAEKKAYNDAAQERISIAEQRRDKLLEIVEVEKENAIRAVENERKEILAVRLQEDRDIEDSLKRQDRAREALHTRNIRRLEKEADKLRTDSEKAVRKIEDQADEEEKRHLKAVRRIEDKESKSLEAIDKETKALDRAERLEDERRRRRDLAQRRSAAQTTLFRALGSQNPAEIAGAREKLTQAIRVGDPEAVRKAQEELIDISGKGRDAIAAAQLDLANIEEDLLAENVKQSKEAEKDKLDDKQDSIRKQVEAEKRQEEDRNRARKDRLDKDKQAEKDRLDDALKKIDKAKEAEKDRYEKDKEGAKDAAETAKRALEDRRRVEDDKYKNDLERIKLTAEAEINAIKATYDDEPNGLIPSIRRAIKVANDEYEKRNIQVRKSYEEERENIEKTYDGLIQQHRRIEEDAQRAYSKLIATKNAHYDAEAKRIKEMYTNSNGTGIIDRLTQLKTDTENKLKNVLTEWEKHKEGLVGENGVFPQTFKEALEQVDDFIAEMKKRGGITISPRIVVSPPPSFPGSSGSGSSGSDSGDGGPRSGGGPGAGNLPTVQPTPGPGIGTGDDAGEVDVSPSRFATSFGFQATYSKPFSSRIPRHRGVDLVIKGAERGGFGLPVGAFRPGTVYAVTYDDNGGNGITIAAQDGLYDRYFHFDSMNVRVGQQVKRGQQIGILGESGTKGSPHLHYEVVSAAGRDKGDYEDGPNPQINPVPYMQARDAGYLFRNPTMYQDIITGERGVLAEKAPERLLGSRDTRKLETMLQNAPRMATNSLSPATQSMPDYSIIGSSLAGIGASSPTIVEGDNMVYNGVTPESVLQQFRDDQRRQRVLRGGN